MKFIGTFLKVKCKMYIYLKWRYDVLNELKKNGMIEYFFAYFID